MTEMSSCTALEAPDHQEGGGAPLRRRQAGGDTPAPRPLWLPGLPALPRMRQRHPSLCPPVLLPSPLRLASIRLLLLRTPCGYGQIWTVTQAQDKWPATARFATAAGRLSPRLEAGALRSVIGGRSF